ncbi:MAG TPA: DUF2231 domain-containing protein [Acidimicrobiales bacterium]|jgi:uncharacterized membrane protein
MDDGNRSSLYDLAERIEGEAALDPLVSAVDAVLPGSFREGEVRDMLGGRWLGHALHPMLTDFPLGAWMSASLLDLIGGKSSRTASRRLVGFGILAAVPTAVTGASDWTQGTQQERRVGVVHAVANTTALSFYIASFLARRRGRHWSGVGLGILGGLAATTGGFFGGHLSLGRDIGRRATDQVVGERGSPAPFNEVR